MRPQKPKFLRLLQLARMTVVELVRVSQRSALSRHHVANLRRQRGLPELFLPFVSCARARNLMNCEKNEKSNHCIKRKWIYAILPSRRRRWIARVWRVPLALLFLFRRLLGRQLVVNSTQFSFEFAKFIQSRQTMENVPNKLDRMTL